VQDVEELHTIEVALQPLAHRLPLPGRQMHWVLLGRHDLERAGEPVPRREEQALVRVQRRMPQAPLDQAYRVLTRPARSASCAWVIPWRRRASRTSSPPKYEL
jgi:hypothetical protein